MKKNNKSQVVPASLEKKSSKEEKRNSDYILKQLEPKQAMPILFLDVALGVKGSVRIVVYEGDDVNEIVQAFSKKHDLSKKKLQKLTQAINAQLSQHLFCIEEED